MISAISIIIPVYNAEKYLNKCIESILSQKFDAYEVILVNDGSTDSSGIICRQYAESYKFIHYIEQENKGVCSARNTGLDAAKGELIFFMDSDDWIEKDGLIVLYNEYKRTKADLTIADMRFDRTVKKKDIHIFNESFTTSDRIWISKYELACIGYGYNPNPGTKYNITGLGSMGNKLYRRDIIEKHKLRFDPYTLGIYEDNLFVLHYLIYTHSVSYISTVIYNYRAVADSNSRGYKGNTLDINNRIFQRIQEYIQTYKKQEEEQFQKAFYMYVIRRLEDSLSVYFFSKGNPNSFFSKILKLKKTIKSVPYIDAINNVELDLLKPKHRYTCITAKSRSGFIIWVGYMIKLVAYRMLKILNTIKQ